MKKRHHFVPSSYLRGFSRDNVVWTYDTEQGEMRWSSPEATGFEKHLYSVTNSDGTKDARIEDLIAEIEGKGMPVLLKLAKGEAYSEQERMDFASFVAMMYVRTDSFRQTWAEMSMSFLHLQAYATAMHDGAFEAFLERRRKEGDEIDESKAEEIRDIMKDPGRFEWSVSKEWTLHAIKAHDDMAPIFFRMHWTVIEAPEREHFLTGDCPVNFEVPHFKRNSFLRGGLKDRDVELLFPLTSKQLFFASWHEEVPERITITRDNVRQINRYTAVNARRYLYYHEGSKGIQNLGEKHKGHRRRFEMTGFVPETPASVSMRRK